MKFIQKRRQDKLYKQWVKHGDLPLEAIPQKESPREVPISREREAPISREREAPIGRERKGRGLGGLYLLLIISFLILGLGLVFLWAHWR